MSSSPLSKRCQVDLVIIPFSQERSSFFYDNELYIFKHNVVGPSKLAGRAKQWERQNITIDQYFEVPLAAANFDKTKVLKEQHRYYKDFTAKFLWQKNVSIQEKRIPEFANTSTSLFRTVQLKEHLAC